MKTASLLSLRKKMQKQRPSFVVKEAGYTARVKVRWRFPRGRHSPVRQMHCGRLPLPTPGYGSPRLVRGMHPSGLMPVRVHTLTDLAALKAGTQGAIIASTLSVKKKMELLDAAIASKITVLNVRDPQGAIASIQRQFEQQKEAKKRRLQVKGTKEEGKKKKAEEKNRKAEEEKKKEAQEKATEEAEEIQDQEMKEQHKEIEKELIKRQ